MLTFEYPLVFLGLVVYFILVRYFKAKNDSLYFSNISMLKEASKKQNLILSLLKFFSVLFLIIALASPIKKDELEEQKGKGYEIALLIDVSASMLKDDKFANIKKIAKEFIQKRKDDSLALTVFADFAYVAVPLTYDKDSILRLLDMIEVGVAGSRRTALYEALFLGANLFENSIAKEKIIVLATDGMDNSNTVPIDVAIDRAKKYGIKVHTIGIGRNTDYNPLNHDYNSYVLRKIARATGGKEFHAKSNEKLKEIYEEIDALEKSEVKKQRHYKKTYYYQIFLGLAILTLIALFLYRNKKEVI
ncbi:von Willebrand factor type A (vWA) domain-containing protein (BatA domain), putative oxygen tolerance protein BatA [Campylobacter blaseri]|uniref:VWFA domain-containing protein n=1 Tax=Campylobacter blaseri TaxID=2042961 RepID=A0A2P8R072_9BACT|nr:VWA domain-containing protein [Campylobacter blaseri]PSM51897.1 hypothetical protein CQ405_04850 [Campylobacter blaseri]PSM53681.1 hypothetical protein CRN67_04850 [Campylobacter blaseri]QKF85766.1 von Willebrand factor type A (vWA) domain-containing protein (BatA domain), putative oxygen tolerance protein BatA [Campylobacter blaseri]